MSQLVLENISAEDLRSEIEGLGKKRIFVVTGNKSFRQSGAQRFIEAGLDGLSYCRFYEFDVNPKLEDVRKGIKAFQEQKSDLILAIGGGSTIDIAKSIKALADEPPQEYEALVTKNIIKCAPVPLIAIPTTSGTGSEATHFSVVYVAGKKYSVAHQCILPNIAVLNYEFTLTQSAYLTGCVSYDAFSQAIESLWSVNATPESKSYSLEAIRLIGQNYMANILKPTPETRSRMMKASFLAGKAINIAKTTAAHAMSYSLTQRYGIPHGHAVAISLGKFLELNLKHSPQAIYNKHIDEEAIDSVRKQLITALACTDLEEVIQLLSDFMDCAGMKTKLTELGAESTADIETIVSSINVERLGNNPLVLSTNDLKEVVKRIW